MLTKLKRKTNETQIGEFSLVLKNIVNYRRCKVNLFNK